jgi:hypothetical protein
LPFCAPIGKLERACFDLGEAPLHEEAHTKLCPRRTPLTSAGAAQAPKHWTCRAFAGWNVQRGLPVEASVCRRKRDSRALAKGWQARKNPDWTVKEVELLWCGSPPAPIMLPRIAKLGAILTGSKLSAPGLRSYPFWRRARTLREGGKETMCPTYHNVRSNRDLFGEQSSIEDSGACNRGRKWKLRVCCFLNPIVSVLDLALSDL